MHADPRSAQWSVASRVFPHLGDVLQVPVVSAGLVQMQAEQGLGGSLAEHDGLLVGSGSGLVRPGTTVVPRRFRT
jgi:hypothetical protein